MQSDRHAHPLSFSLSVSLSQTQGPSASIIYSMCKGQVVFTALKPIILSRAPPLKIFKNLLFVCISKESRLSWGALCLPPLVSSDPRRSPEAPFSLLGRVCGEAGKEVGLDTGCSDPRQASWSGSYVTLGASVSSLRSTVTALDPALESMFHPGFLSSFVM